jgi:hypothetical protein
MPALAWEPAIVGLDETGNGRRITSVGALDATGAVTPEMVGSGDGRLALELALGVTDPTGAVMPEVVSPAPARPSRTQVAAARPADTTGSNATDRLACTCHQE